MRSLMLACLSIFLLSVTQAGQVRGQTTLYPASTYVDRLGHDLLANFEVYESEPSAGAEGLKSLLRDQFATETISTFLLGSAWTKASPKQRTDFNDAIGTYMVDAFVRLLLSARPKHFEVMSSIDQGENGVVVTTSIMAADGSSKSLDWRVVRENGQDKVADMRMNGISQAVTYRSEFKSILANQGIAGLTRALTAKSR